MELSSEVCQTLKSAIKARLKELGIAWDRELPDYVMVLIKNKKSKEQMTEDLNIFLGSHTVDFTNWLHDVWKKLEVCATSSKGVKKKEDDKKTKVKRRSSDENQLEAKKSRPTGTKYGSESELSPLHSSSLQGRSPLCQSENGYGNHSSSENKDLWEKRLGNSGTYKASEKEEQKKPRERIEISWSDEKPRENGQPTKTRKERSRSRSERSRSKSRNRSRSWSRPKEEGASVLRRGSKEGGRYREKERRGARDARELIRSRASQERGIRTREKADRTKFEKEKNLKNLKDKDDEKLPSLVKVTPRPVRPPSMQPSSNLILKAVADAQKSIAITSLPQPEDKLGNIENNSQPPRKKPIFKNKLGPSFEPNISITLLNDRISSNMGEICMAGIFKAFHNALGCIIAKESPWWRIESVQRLEEGILENAVEENRVIPQIGPEIQRFTISLQSDDDSIIGSDHEGVETNEPEPNGFEQKFVEQVQVKSTELPEPEPMDISADIPIEINEVPEYPVYRFDRSRLGPRVVPDADTVLSCLAPSSQITKTIVNENAFSEGSESKSDENEKLIKCKFWPSCEAGDSCRFYHPKTYCRTLPNCKFGQKCLFIHPPCKFGDQCLNVACPYVHKTAVAPTATAPSTTGKVWTKVPLAPSNGQICMFFPNCTKPFCPYQHYAAPGSGIPCKYGMSCTKLGCEFDHPQTSKNPYKWVAPNPE